MMDDRIKTPTIEGDPMAGDGGDDDRSAHSVPQPEVETQVVNCVRRPKLHRKLANLWACGGSGGIEPLVICNGKSNTAYMILEIELS